MDDDSPRKEGKKSEIPSSPRTNGTSTSSEMSTPALALFSPASSTCSASTFGTSNATQTLLPSSGQRGIDQQRRHLLHQTYFLCGLSVASFGAFLFFLLPPTALVALAIFVSSTSSIFFLIYQSLLLEWQSIVQGRGIGDYLPESVYRQLADMSLHEWMMDGTFYLENRYLLLYFVPGITQEQLDSYLDHVSPHHRRNLHRQGLGQFLGNDFMRILMGESRWLPRLAASQPRPRELILENTPRHLFDVVEESKDDGDNSSDSDIGLEISADDLAGDIDDRQASALARFVGLAGIGQHAETEIDEVEQAVLAQSPVDAAGEEEEDLQQRYNDEGQVMTEAYSAMTLSYTMMAANMATSTAAQVVEYVSPYVIGTGFGLTSLSAGIGMFGMWMGRYQPRGSLPSPHLPQSRTLWITAIFGGTSAGLMLLIRTGIRRSLASATIEEDEKKDEK